MNNYKKKSEAVRAKLTIERENWKNEEGTYGIFKCRLNEADGEVKTDFKGCVNIKGEIPYLLKEGKQYVIYVRNPEYNDKFKNYTYYIDRFETEELTLPEEQFEFLSTVTTESIYKQLESLYEGLPIIDMIFEDKIDLTKVNGLAEKTYDKLKDKLNLYKDLGKLQNMLKPLGVTIRSIKNIAKHFKSPDAAYYKLQESLYNLCEVKGFGFAKVDEIALKGGTDPLDPLRIKYCLGYLLEQGGQQGHSWNYREDIKVEALDLLQINPENIDKFLDENVYVKGRPYDFQDIIVVNDLVSIFSMYFAERNTLDNLDRINREYVPLDMDEQRFNVEIDFAQEALGIIYTEEQRNAIVESFKSGVYVVEGKSGTGKTTILKGIVQIHKSIGSQCVAVALSGKAANVLSSRGLNAATVHRTLGYQGDRFVHGEGNPIPYQLINLDEAGMAHAELWNALTSAIANGSHFIVSGDSGQLAAIGAGDILRDILASKRYAKVELQQIHRQAADSGVIEIAHKVREGVALTGYNHEMNEVYGNNKDLRIITRFKPRKDDVVTHAFMSDEEKKEAFNPIYLIAKQILEEKISRIKASLDPEKELLDFQVLCPTKKAGALGVDSINQYIQSIYNDNKEGIVKNGITYKKDDKIIVSGNKYDIIGYESLADYRLGKHMMTELQFSNEYKEEMEEEGVNDNDAEGEPTAVTYDLFNGTIGIVKGCFPDSQQIVVKFDGIPALIAIHEDDMDAIDLGYAITVHKSQGISQPNVLFLFDFSAFGLLSKQLVYTAITRTSTGECIMLCENNALVKAINTDSSGNRRTFMKLFLDHLDSLEEE